MRKSLRAATVLALSSLLLASPSAAAPPARPRVVVLGFDGADAVRCEELMSQGKLPYLKALGSQGGYARLRPANPAESPVSWATLTTGWNPGKTGIYDFLRRKHGKDARSIDIQIGLAEPVQRDVLGAEKRAGIVLVAGVIGGIFGFGVAFALGVFVPLMRRGGRLQATVTAG